MTGSISNKKNMYKNIIYKSSENKSVKCKYVLLCFYFYNIIKYGHQKMIKYNCTNQIEKKIIFLDFYNYKIENYIINYKLPLMKKYIENSNFIIKNRDLKEYKEYIKNKIMFFKQRFINNKLNTKNIKNDYELIRNIDLYSHYKDTYCFNNVMNFIDNINIKNKICNICDECIDNNKIIITDCGHMFCINCFFSWGNKHKKCPECRKDINTKTLTHIVEKNYKKKIFESYKINYLVKFLGNKITFIIKYIYDYHKNSKILFLSKNNIILEIVSNILTRFNIKNVIYPEYKDYDNDIILLNYPILKKKITIKKNTVIIFYEPPKDYKEELKIFANIFSYNSNKIESTVKFIIRGTEEEKML